MNNQKIKIATKIATKITIILLFLICSQYILTGVYIGKEIIGGITKEKSLFSVSAVNNNETTEDPNKGQYLRLSNTLTENSIPYRSESRVGYGKLRVNEIDDNHTKISIKVEGANYPFDYGIFAHANSEVYYDVSKYSEKYHKFTAYVGLNSTSTSGDGVKFWIYTSNKDTFYSSGTENWEVKKEVDITPGKNAEFIEVDITGAKYLRLQAYQKTGNGHDHSVYVNPMLITDKYKEDENEFKSVEYYDQKIKDYANKDLSDPNYELLVLQRKFRSNLGDYALKRFISEDPNNKATIEWLMNDLENLRYFILGGTPTGGYFNALKQLTRLLGEYKNDFNDTTEISEAGKALLDQKQLNWPKTKGNLYKRMAITLSLTHSSTIALWMQSGPKENQSDALVRYEQYKTMYNTGKFKATDSVDITPWFETYTIEEMRYVMHVMLDDEEVFWLNEYTQSKIDAEPNRAWSYLTPHPYMAYIFPNYGDSRFYDEENKDYFNDLFKVGDKKLWDYGITRGTSNYKLYKLWMNFRNKFGTGAVCGGISKSGHCIRGVHAIPSAVIGQPGHAAIIYYSRNSNGQGYWGIDNDVSGWTQSEKGERLPLGWGSDRWYRGTYNIPYIILAQEALNDYNNFVKAEELLMIADVYKDDLAKQEELYKEAIKVQSINLDAWLGLMKLYLADSTKTEEQYYNLAKEMMESLKCFPFTMYDLANKIKPKFTSNEYKFKYSILETRILTEGKNYPNEGSQVLQPSVTRLLASYLLGRVDTSLAKFSFDGTDAGKIVLSDRFNGNGIRWDYSLDGKKTWNEVSFTDQEEHKLQLTQKQIESITSENDIYVHIVGVNYNEENLYKIDILESAGLPATIFANDKENRVVAVNLITQWRYTEKDPWTSYSQASPDLTGNKTVQLRQGATGTHLASKEPTTFTFTEDTDTDKRKYIPVSHLSKVAVSTEAVNNGGAAVNALDANYNTRYHSAWNGTDTQRYLTVKLDKPVYLSAVEFVPAGGGNGRIVDGTIWGSKDGENWEVLSQRKGITYAKQANTNEDAVKYTQSFEITEPKEIQYVKIVADKTNGNWFAARAFNFYEDLTKKPVATVPTASIAYSTTKPTSEPVVARLVNPSTKITITNNDGNDTYIFTENGKFTFEFEDEDGNKGTTEAKVDWIDKNAPTADVEYKLSDDKKLIAILENISEDVYLLDENNNKINYIEVNEDKKVTNITYLDNEGNSYKVLDKDENGNTTKITYKNTTNKVPNVATYITTLKTKADGNDEIKIGEVIKEEYFDKEGNPVTITDAEKQELRQLQQIARSNPLEYALETSGEYQFKMLDKADNLLYKSLKVDYIDNDTKILASDITYDITNTTNKDVVATIKPYMIDVNGNKDVDVEIINNNGKSTYTFTKNDEITFQYAEAKQSEEGLEKEVKTHTAKVDWIDKTAPTAQIKYSTTEATKGNVIATLEKESETIIITNNSTNREYTFTKNGEFTFEFEDKAGNKGTATAKVDWINSEYQLGDVNEDGKITATDLLLLKRHLVAGEKQEWILTEDKFKAGDMNEDGKITATDLILMKRLVLKQIEVQ